MNKRSMIMTDEQARSVYSAMSALKASGGRVIVVFQRQDFGSIRVRQLSGGSVRVRPRTPATKATRKNAMQTNQHSRLPTV